MIVMEHDVDDPFRSSGAIIMEQYTALSPEQVMEKAQQLANGGKYGRIWTATLKELVQTDPELPF